MNRRRVITATEYRVAANLIREGGLVKGSYQDGGAHCTVGALYAATGTNISIDLEVSPLAELLGREECLTHGWDCVAFSEVTNWNDEPERTAQDVITLLEQAAEKLEADQ